MPSWQKGREWQGREIAGIHQVDVSYKMVISAADADAPRSMGMPGKRHSSIVPSQQALSGPASEASHNIRYVSLQSLFDRFFSHLQVTD